MTKSKREGKIFLDYFRNGYGATSVAPYSVRARGVGTIAMPIQWKELNRHLKSDQFTVRDLLDVRLSKRDPWSGIEKLQKLTLLEKPKSKRTKPKHV
jgi:bifunctional non-homologous end joining protein LigD